MIDYQTIKRKIQTYRQRLFDEFHKEDVMERDEFLRKMEEGKKRKQAEREGALNVTTPPAQTTAIDVAGASNVAVIAEKPKVSKAFAIIKKEGTMLYFLRIYSIIGTQIVGQEDSVEDLFGMVMGRLENEVEYDHQ